MPTFTTYREASKDEMGREIDRCHKVIADLEARLARVPDREAVARAVDTLKAYEQWEASIIMDGDWSNDTPRLTQDQMDRLIELQSMRNTAIRALGEKP